MTPVATRGVGAIGALQGALPDPVLAALRLATQLGDVWFLVTLLVLVYWFRARHAGAFAAGATLAAFALTLALKAWFGLPRPPEALWLGTAEGYGFPSGHALGATVAWGALALGLDVGTRRRRLAAAGAVVGIVALSRVAIGVHYLVDVVVGLALGAALLAALARWARDPVRAFAVAAALSLVAVGVTGGGRDAAMLLGGSVAGLVAWRAIDVPTRPWGRDDLVPAAGASIGVGAAFGAGYATTVGAAIAATAGALTMVLAIGAPAAVERVRG